MFSFSQKGHDSRAISNLLVEKFNAANLPLDVPGLQRYVYLAHAWVLGYTGKPLIQHDIVAWPFGPGVPEISGAFGGQGEKVTVPAHDYHPEFGELPPYSARLSSSEKEILDQVYSRYSGKFDQYQLHALITQKGTPWDQYRDRVDETIPNSLIAGYYQELIAA